MGQNEVGNSICRTKAGQVVLGPQAEGTPMSVKVSIQCPPGSAFEGIYHCLPPWEYIYTPGYGPLPAEEAYQHWLPNAERHEASSLVELTLSHGGKLTVTPNHPILTHGYWLLAELIIPSEKLTYQNNLPVSVEEELPPLSYRVPKRYLSQVKYWPGIPERMSPELGEFLGLIWSDGSVWSGSNGWNVGFANLNQELLHHAKNLAEDLFGLEGITYSDAVHWNSTLLAHWFADDLGFGKKRVPRCIWTADFASRQAFLNGVIAGDGTISGNGRPNSSGLGVSICTGAIHEAAVSLAYLCATLDIKARIHQSKQSWENRNYDYIYDVEFQCGNAPAQVPVKVEEKILRDGESGRFLPGNQSGQRWTGGKTIGDDVVWVRNVRELPGKVIVYDFHSSDQVLYAGSLPITTHNTHPGGVPIPSQQDLKSGRQVGAKVLCIKVPDTGVTQCYRRQQ